MLYAFGQDEGDFESSFCAFVLDTGLTFQIPCFHDMPFTAAALPDGAKEWFHPDICGQTIVRLIRPRHDEDFYPETALLGLATGKWVCHCFVGPIGISYPGLYVLERNDDELSDFADFWDCLAPPEPSEPDDGD